MQLKPKIDYCTGKGIYTIKIQNEECKTQKVGTFELVVKSNSELIEIMTIISSDLTKSKEISNVKISSRTYLPQMSNIEIVNEGINIKLTAIYEKKKVKLIAITPSGEFTKVLNHTGNIFDNIEMLFLIPFLDFTVEEEQKIRVLSVQSGEINDIVIMLLGEETGHINGCQIDCVRICVTSSISPEIRQYMLYENSSQCRLIRWTNGNQCVELDYL